MKIHKGTIPTKNPTEKKQEIIALTETPDNKIEVLTFLAKVQSRIKKDISEDFTLAKLNDKDKISIIEMTSNAYYTKKIMMIIAEKSEKTEYNNKEKKWTKRKLNDEEIQTIINIANLTFDTFMTRIYMTVILNRNVDANQLLRIIAQAGEEETPTETEEEPNGILDIIKKKLKPKKKSEEE